MLKSESVVKIIEAPLAAQKKIEPVVKENLAKGTKFNFTYADLSAVIEAVKVPLNENGIVLLQSVVKDCECLSIETLLYHTSGEFVGSITPIFMSGTDPQSFGSGVTYAKRYGLSALLGIATEDDDGNAAKPKSVIAKPTEQEQIVIDKIYETLFDSVPPEMTLNKDRIASVLYATKGAYPDDIKKASTIAAWLISQKKMPELCTGDTK